MTDKQIIIDGVPVQDCCYFDYENDGYEDSCYIHQNECSAQNCYYKEYKRSEAQCEAMFVSHTDLEKKYKAKEQECEELKKQHQADKGLITATGKMNYELLQEYDKLKTENKRLEDLYDRVLQTLKDIEIITQQGIDFFNETERHADWEKVAIFMKQQLSFILGEIEEG